MEKRERRNSFFRRAALAACLFACVSSCKKDGGESEAPAAGAFTALTESHAGDGKTWLDPETGKVLWKRGDRIMVYSSGEGAQYQTGVPFVAETAGESSEFEAGGAMPDNFINGGNSYAAVYPVGAVADAAAGFSGDDKQFTVKIPRVQEYVEGGFAQDANPMVAFSNSNVLPFKNVCGMLRLQLFGVTPVDSIVIESMTGDEKLWGRGTVKVDDAGIPQPVSESDGHVVGGLDGGKSVALKVSPAVQLGLDEATEFRVLLPAGSCSNGFKVTVYDPWGGDWSKVAMGLANEIKRSEIKTMNAVRAITSVAMYEKDGAEVRWATVNIGAHAPWEYGDYYAWGATEVLYTPGVYNLTNWCPGNSSELSISSYLDGKSYGWNAYCPYWKEGTSGDIKFLKYVTSVSEHDYGDVDNKQGLEFEDDVASVLYGGAWRMPKAGGSSSWAGYTGDFKDLCEACNIKDTSVPNNLKPYSEDGVGKDVKGMWFENTRDNDYKGHKIFLPAVGYCNGTSRFNATSNGFYWSRSLDSTTPFNAYGLDFGSGSVNPAGYYNRYYGLSVRPVL